MNKSRLLGAVCVYVCAFGLPVTATASFVYELEPNDTIATAENIDNFFSLNSDPNI